MPEIVSCPNCQRRSRLPDALIGKKVKCPQCKEIFTALVAGPPTAKTEAVKSKKDDADPGYEVVDEDEGDGKPSRRRRSDDDDDDERVADRPRSRRRSDDDDDEDDERVTRRRRRFSRDDDDDDDDDDDYDRPRSRPKVRANWPRVLSGLTLIMWATILSVCLAIMMFLGVMICGGMGAAAAARGGPAAGAGAVGGLVILAVVGVLGGLACYVMRIVGHVFCLPSPEARGARMLALVTVILVFLELGCQVLGWVVSVGQFGMAGLAGAANPMPVAGGMAAAAGLELLLTGVRLLATVAWFFVFMFYLRAIALITGNDWLAANIVKFMITSVAVVVGWVVWIGVIIAVGRAGGAAGGICLCVTGIAALVIGVGMLIWYIQILVNTRNALASRMGRA
jgi:hypothetical protein